MNDHEPYKDYEYDDDFECEEEHSNHNFDDKVKSGKLNSNIRNWNTYVSKNNDEEVDKPAIESDSSQIPGKKSVHSIIDSPTTTGPSGRSRGKSNSDVSSKLKERTKKRSKGTVGWIQREEWSIGENIGKGSFGSVFQCMNNKGKLFAVKRIEMSASRRESVDDLVHEIDLMRGFHHPNIVEYIGASVDEKMGHVYIFQEWVSGGSVAHLLKLFGPFGEGVVMNYTRQILHGLSYLHDHGIVHRDVKGGNVLIDESGSVKLADFGASTKLGIGGTQELKDIKGTPYFMAPEVLGNSRYGRKGDIWAVGCTMVQMLTGEPPWKDRNLQGIVQLHMLLSTWPGGPPITSGPQGPLGIDTMKVLEMCFRKDERLRPSALEILEDPVWKAVMHDDDDDASSFEYQSSLESTMKSYSFDGENSGVMTGLKEKMTRALSICSTPNTPNRPFQSSPYKEMRSPKKDCLPSFTPQSRSRIPSQTELEDAAPSVPLPSPWSKNNPFGRSRNAFSIDSSISTGQPTGRKSAFSEEENDSNYNANGFYDEASEQDSSYGKPITSASAPFRNFKKDTFLSNKLSSPVKGKQLHPIVKDTHFETGTFSGSIGHETTATDKSPPSYIGIPSSKSVGYISSQKSSQNGSESEETGNNINSSQSHMTPVSTIPLEGDEYPSKYSLKRPTPVHTTVPNTTPISLSPVRPLSNRTLSAIAKVYRDETFSEISKSDSGKNRRPNSVSFKNDLINKVPEPNLGSTTSRIGSYDVQLHMNQPVPKSAPASLTSATKHSPGSRSQASLTSTSKSSRSSGQINNTSQVLDTRSQANRSLRNSLSPLSSSQLSSSLPNNKDLSNRNSGRYTGKSPNDSSKVSSGRSTNTSPRLKSESNRKLSEDGDSEQWVCLKCSYQNDNPIHCDNCATIRGATGKRDTSAVIPHS